MREGNARLSDRLMEVKMENKKLRQISADYTRVKRVFGPEQVEAAVEADKQREQAEKGRNGPGAPLTGEGGDFKKILIELLTNETLLHILVISKLFDVR